MSSKLTNSLNLLGFKWYIRYDFAGYDDRINSFYYSNFVSQARKLRRKGRKLDLYYLNDNAPIHTSVVSRFTIENYVLNVISHPPYSPDLASSDFYLFSNLKKTLRGQQFPNMEYLKSALAKFFNEKHPDFFKKAFLELAFHWKKYADVFRD